MTSNQASPVKGGLNGDHYDYYRGIDISSQRSPFKHMNKQSPA